MSPGSIRDGPLAVGMSPTRSAHSLEPADRHFGDGLHAQPRMAGLLPAPMRPDEVLRVPGKGRRRAQHLVSEQEGHVADPVAAHLQVQWAEDVPGLEVSQPAVHHEGDRQDGERLRRDDQRAR